MIKAVFIDDEPLALRQLEMYAARIPELAVLGTFTSASSSLGALAGADVLFIDINMPDISGMEFVRSLENPPLVVFTTAYAEYAVEGFRVNATDYLLKPFSLVEFRRSVQKVQEVLDLRRAAAPSREVIVFKTEHRTVPVRLEDIRYVESMSEYVKIHLCGTRAPLVVLYSLKRLVEELPAARFARIHRSYIISTDHLREATATRVVLDDDTTLPVGAIYRPSFLSTLSAGR